MIFNFIGHILIIYFFLRNLTIYFKITIVNFMTDPQSVNYFFGCAIPLI